MKEYEYHPIYEQSFVGRDTELEYLRSRHFNSRGSFSPTLVSGEGGVGKTSLVKHFLASSRLSSIPYWINVEIEDDAEKKVDHFIEVLYETTNRSNFIVVFDGSDSLSDNKIREITSRIYNIKATRGLIFTERRKRNIDRAETIALQNLNHAEASALANLLIDYEIDPSSLAEALNVAKGHPLAITLLAQVLKYRDATSISNILSGQLYDFSNLIALPEREIITTVKPRIISATDHLVQKLRKQPQAIFDIAPRKFEELLAELLTDLGWDVELTKATGDGGKDILAYLDTEVGKILCLVEAKRYREDRKIGVGLVRTLYGTLYDHRASSAMLVTTSSFTSGAKDFQQKYEYQLALRDYSDVVQWIQNYKNIEI